MKFTVSTHLEKRLPVCASFCTRTPAVRAVAYCTLCLSFCQTVRYYCTFSLSLPVKPSQLPIAWTNTACLFYSSLLLTRLRLESAHSLHDYDRLLYCTVWLLQYNSVLFFLVVALSLLLLSSGPPLRVGSESLANASQPPRRISQCAHISSRCKDSLISLDYLLLFSEK